MWRFYWLALLLALSYALLAQQVQTTTAPSTATATQTATAPTGTNASPSDAKANLSWLHWLAENLKDIAGIVAAIFIMVTAVMFTKRGRLIILGAVLDGFAADPASAKRLYEGILLSETADQTRARKIYDLVISVDEDRARIYDRVIHADQSRGMITTAVIRRLSEDPNSIRQLLNLIVGEFGGNRSKDFAELLARRENQQILKAMHDIRAVTSPQDAAQKDDK